MIERIKGPYFTFPEISPFEEFSFEKLSSENFQQLYKMLHKDESAFTDERFKQLDKAKEYAEHIEQYGAHSPKHGGQDWLFLWKGEYAGIFHLYDLSLETFAENNRRCWIGFATKPEMRNKGITRKALQYFSQYIFQSYPLIKYIHSMTLPQNEPAKALLRSLGFKEDATERMSDKYAFYLLEKTDDK